MKQINNHGRNHMRLAVAFYVSGIVLAMSAGFNSLGWYYILISAVIMFIGLFIHKILLGLQPMLPNELIVYCVGYT